VSAATLTVTLLEKVNGPNVDALRKDAADVLRFLGLTGRAKVVIEA